MIKNQGFTAREAMSWLRWMRPGSVIGMQQLFLTIIERATWNGNRIIFPAEFVTRWRELNVASLSQTLAQQVAHAVGKRGSNVQTADNMDKLGNLYQTADAVG